MEASTDAPACRLYLITPERLDPKPFADMLARALDAGDVAAVQLRLKGVTDDDIRAAALALKPIVQKRGVAFLLNDRPDLAAEVGADGVHIGADDMPYAKARALVGADAIVGVSCYASRHDALVAAEAGADYVAFGAFFPTRTKEPPARAGIDLLEWWSEIMTVPCVAIGGITAENCAPLVQAGADFLAVVSAVWDHPDGPGAGVANLNGSISVALKQKQVSRGRMS
ncbi:MAG TPA: thiamine phosphate synthase [Alphaproteobacteria bacterium]|nr:thiamine phosphate synthase [Alphaproteobacteria bacterium]